MSDFNSFSNQFFDRRQAMRPTRRTWVKHIFLLLVTFVTCTIAGVIYPFGLLPLFPELNSADIPGFTDVLLALPFLYVELVREAVYLIFTDPVYTYHGLSFSVSTLFILISHEMGHYIACRIYGVDATLPFFIPTPPLIGPAGTLGAFIKIVSPMPSRRAVFDIGVAGPIAGFIALIPVAVIAFLTMEQIPREPLGLQPGDLYFSDPLFMKFLALVFGRELTYLVPNGFYFATWLGLLVTALNLIPSGQLDGGHAMFAVFGERVHFWTGRIAFVLMALFSILGMYLYGSPSGFLFAIILAVMMKVRHPEPLDNSPLDLKRKLIAFLTLVLFILCFVPFPVQLN